MQTQPRLPEMTLAQPIAPAPDRLEAVLERLTATGYMIDREKFARLEAAGLVDYVVPTSRGEREAIKRLRRILDVERRLSPGGDTDALAYHLAAAGVDGVPAGAVVRHIVASVRSLVAIGARVSGDHAALGAGEGPDAERRAAASIAQRCLGGYLLRDLAEREAAQAVLAAAFVAYVRTVNRAVRPAALLHESSRLVSLDDVGEQLPRARRREEPLPPLVSVDDVCDWIATRAAMDDRGLFKAVKTVAALLRLHSRRYPELQIAWRDAAAEYGAGSGHALTALACAPPVLAAAYLQAGHLPDERIIGRALEQLMHAWGTTIRRRSPFGLSNGHFPWVSRT